MNRFKSNHKKDPRIRFNTLLKQYIAVKIDKFLPELLVSEGYSQALNRIEQVNIARRVLRRELCNGSDLSNGLKESKEELNRELPIIEAIWGQSLNLLDLQVEFSRHACLLAKFYMNQNPTSLAEALVRIHGRGCLVASEICNLLRSGYANGAEARWRTLYELEVISIFLGKWGDDLAGLYLAYQVVESKKMHKANMNYYERLGENITSDEEKQYRQAKVAFDESSRDIEKICYKFGFKVKSSLNIEDNQNNLSERFRHCFEKDYGWARCAIGKKNPNFKGIVEAVGYLNADRVHKSAHFPIHGGPTAAFFSRSMPSSDYMLVGPSRYGLEHIIKNTSVSLEKLTEVSSRSNCTIGLAMINDIQYVLTEEIEKAANEAEKKLGPIKPPMIEEKSRRNP